MYVQELVCPWCGEMMNVNVPDQGSATTPCKNCRRKTTVTVDEQGKVTIDKGCLVSTACLKSVGHGEDCRELAVLRTFRDSYLRGLPEGPSLIAEYYSIAPNLVRKIDERSDQNSIWQEVYFDIQESVILIESGEPEKAAALYKKMIAGLKLRLLKPPTTWV